MPIIQRNLSTQDILNGSFDPDNYILRILPIGKVAIGRTVSGSISASTSISISAAAKMIRVYAIDKDVYLKWGSTAVTSSNFDEVIPANQICDFYIPESINVCTVIERSATATIIVIQK
jgi:hypothetical protein